MKKIIVLIGAKGMLAAMLKQELSALGDVHELDLPDFDISNSQQVDSLICALRPDLIINCAAFTQVDLCESRQEDAHQVNGLGPGYLANAAHQVGAVLVHISTDFVFSGDKNTPYSEEDPVAPLSVYGRSKLEGEEAILVSPLERYYIVRTSWLYGPGGGNFVETVARLASERQELGIVADQRGTPTYTADLAEAIMMLVVGDKPRKKANRETEPKNEPLSLVTYRQSSPYGLYHFSNEGECSWYEFACEIVNQLRKKSCPVKAQKIKPIRTEDYPVPATRPQHSVLSKKKYRETTGADVPDWKDSLRRYFENRS